MIFGRKLTDICLKIKSFTKIHFSQKPGNRDFEGLRTQRQNKLFVRSMRHSIALGPEIENTSQFGPPTYFSWVC